MKAVILAAGRGTRINEVTHGLPKCLLSFGDRTILDFQIDGLADAGISNIAIVVGHNASRIIDHIQRKHPERVEAIRFIHNHEYATTNNIYSLWLTRDWLKGSDFLCLNADVLCHPDILAAAARRRGPVSMVIDPAWRDETMKVIIRNGRILSMSKGIRREDFSGTYIGIARCCRAMTAELFTEISEMIRHGLVNEFFNAAVQRLVERGLRVNPSYTGALPWAEVDDPSDYEFAWNNVYPSLPCGSVVNCERMPALA